MKVQVIIKTGDTVVIQTYITETIEDFIIEKCAENLYRDLTFRYFNNGLKTVKYERKYHD